MISIDSFFNGLNVMFTQNLVKGTKP